MIWTERDEATLAKLWSDGLSVAAISERLCCAPDAVQSKRRNMGLPPRKRGRPSTNVWTPDAVATLTRLHSEGNSASLIAKALGNGITRNAVIGKIHRLGLVRSGASAPSKRLPPANGNTGASKRLPSIAASDSKNERGRVRGRPATARGFGRKAKAEAIDPAHIPATAITLDELPARGRCRWPHGDPAKDTFRFCGHPTGQDEEGASRVYCDQHRKIAYVPSKPKRKRSGNLEGFLDYVSSKRRVYA